MRQKLTDMKGKINNSSIIIKRLHQKKKKNSDKNKKKRDFTMFSKDRTEDLNATVN